MAEELNAAIAGLTRVGEANFSNRMYERAAAHTHLVPEGMARATRANVAQPGVPVVPVDAARYRPPPHIVKLASEEQLVELAKIMDEVKRINDEHVGELDLAVYGLLNGDPEVVTLQNELVQWVDEFAERRLKKRNPRDDNMPIQRFDRVFKDLSLWLNGLANAGANAVVMGLACKYFPWRVYRDTWGRQVRIARTWDNVHINWGSIETGSRKFCNDWLQGTGWIGVKDLELVCKTVCGDAAGADRADELRPRVRQLAAEILETRPFLVNRVKPERTIVELGTPTGTVWLAWTWAQAHCLGMVWLGRTRRDLEEDLHTGRSRTSVAIGMDGRMAISSMPWITLEDQPALPSPWVTNHKMLAALHPILRGFYDRVDFQGLLARRWHTTPTAAPPETIQADDADEVLAASLELLSRAEPTLRRGMVRAEQLFKVLGELGCELRQGKGSEVVVSRPGRRLFTLGHHGANAEVGWATIRRLLSRVGLTVGEWLEVAHR